MTLNVEPGEPLTQRELEVLRVRARTESVAQACHALGISRNTLWCHTTSALVKLDAVSVQGAWRRLGWLDPKP